MAVQLVLVTHRLDLVHKLTAHKTQTACRSTCRLVRLKRCCRVLRRSNGLINVAVHNYKTISSQQIVSKVKTYL